MEISWYCCLEYCGALFVCYGVTSLAYILKYNGITFDSVSVTWLCRINWVTLYFILLHVACNYCSTMRNYATNT